VLEKMIKEDQKPEIDIEINEKDFTMVFWQLLMKGLPKMSEFFPNYSKTLFLNSRRL